MKLSVLLLCVGLFTACDRSKTMHEYGYVFQESTGENHYVLMEGRKVLVKIIVADAPNQMALKSLQALKASVLYPNAAGDKIFLRGELCHAAST